MIPTRAEIPRRNSEVSSSAAHGAHTDNCTDPTETERSADKHVGPMPCGSAVESSYLGGVSKICERAIVVLTYTTTNIMYRNIRIEKGPLADFHNTDTTGK